MFKKTILFCVGWFVGCLVWKLSTDLSMECFLERAFFSFFSVLSYWFVCIKNMESPKSIHNKQKQLLVSNNRAENDCYLP